ncbi:hypothetical protein [Paraconexibacter sp.]|uniref:hypothetical protein n=1 Tax=Paraconexibacter sp. TaxID=2949640 RepID=UPI0035646FAA
MSVALESRAEVAKLARLLGTDDDRFQALAELPAEDLRTLREQVTDVLYDADVEGLRRAAGASKLVPGAVSATIAQRAFGPVLCARIAGLVDTNSAVDVAKRLPTPFLADVAVAMDPRRASDVIGSIPPDHVVGVAAELVARGEHITMGRFVGHLDDETVVASFAVLGDDDMLLTGFVMEDKNRLDTVIALLPSERLHGIIAAAHDHDLWVEALDLFTHVTPQRRGQLGDVAAAQEDHRVEGLIAAVTREDLWEVLVEIAATMTPQSRQRIAEIAGDAVPPGLRDRFGA